MTLLMMVLTATTAWANDAVTYIDMNGDTQTVTEYTEVTSAMTADGSGNINWSSGTYVVKTSVTLSGSMPKGVPEDLYCELIRRCRRAGIPVLLDTSGDRLVAAVREKPSFIKPNEDEIVQLTGRQFSGFCARFIGFC